MSLLSGLIGGIIGTTIVLLVMPWFHPAMDKLGDCLEDKPPLKWWFRYCDWVEQVNSEG